MLSTLVPTSETFNEALHSLPDTVVRTSAIPEPDVLALRTSRNGTSLRSPWSRSSPKQPAECRTPCGGRTGRGSCSRCQTHPANPTLKTEKYTEKSTSTWKTASAQTPTSLLPATVPFRPPQFSTSVSGCCLHKNKTMQHSWFDHCFSRAFVMVAYTDTAQISAFVITSPMS